MRPLRLTLTCATALFGVLCLSYLVTARSRTASIDQQRSPPFSSPLSWSAPSSLFPPSAVISLTDDNSTFFLARPATFGPPLPATGLSGQLWIGSGFGDDKLGAAAEGELGCSDVVSLRDGLPGDPKQQQQRQRVPESVASDAITHKQHGKRNLEYAAIVDDNSGGVGQDGTDDHLHLSNNDDKSTVHSSNQNDHADIQSIQESAEISGKVVLLTRGGCGFLEKVKWAQRRGATALIVGDDVRGGPLVTMYARGDTSNVSIPALFTSYTTAHLLSSLMPAAGRSALHPAVTGTLTTSKNSHVKRKQRRARSMKPFSWLRQLWSSQPHTKNYRRPPSSGRTFDSTTTDSSSATRATPTPAVKEGASKIDAGFVIGVNDWRDPDLVQAKTTSEPSQAGAKPTADKLSTSGDTIMPGSGDYSTQKINAGTDRSYDEQKAKAEYDEAETPSDVHVSNGYREHSAHETLWVTLQPTSTSSSPFFDALLVLVVSPLVTLTVVYALLLLRARIRRRRWRAPKSVVEQLPVRTYHSAPSISSHSSVAGGESPMATTPSSPTATTPLLQASSRPITYRQRSRTEGQIVGGANGSHGGLVMSASTFGSLAEKREAALTEWKRKYGGRQRECVVCLEEYVDGVSKVMSLPCGHEFHVDCM